MGVSQRSARRLAGEAPVASFDTDAEREKRRIGRPSKAEPFRSFLIAELAVQPDVLAVELLRRAKNKGYKGAKSALYGLVKELRPKRVRPIVRFEGLPAEFSQHDFGHVDVRYLDGRVERVHFFASRLKYSRWVEVSLVENEQVEALVRAMVDHFAAWGGAPLVSVFDRPKTIALKWSKDGTVTEWNPAFASVVLDLGLGVELCWPLCGDHIEITLQVGENGVVKDARFDGHGCAISQASADLLVGSIIGKPLEEVKQLDKQYILDMLGIELGPVRLKCALLSLKVLKAGVYGLGEASDDLVE